MTDKRGVVMFMDCFKILPFAMMQQVALVHQQQLSYLLMTCVCSSVQLYVRAYRYERSFFCSECESTNKNRWSYVISHADL